MAKHYGVPGWCFNHYGITQFLACTELARQLVIANMRFELKGRKQYMPTCEFNKIQSVMTDWVVRVLGLSSMHRKERVKRFFEESVELAQATGLTVKQAHRLVDFVYNKPVGGISREIGGVYTTLVTLAQACDKDTLICALMEVDRVHSLPPEKFQKRQQQNIKDGIGR